MANHGGQSEQVDSPLADGMLGVKQASAFTGLGRDQIYNAIRANELRSYKYGKRRLVAKRDLVAWLEKRLTPVSSN